MDRTDLIGSNSSKGLSEDLNGELYTIWDPEAIVENTVATVCDWLTQRYMGYMKCDGVTQSYEFDGERFTKDIKAAVAKALHSVEEKSV